MPDVAWREPRGWRYLPGVPGPPWRHIRTDDVLSESVPHSW